MKTYKMEVEYPDNFRFIDVTAPDARTAKQAIRARDDHHDKVLGIRTVDVTASKAQ